MANSIEFRKSISLAQSYTSHNLDLDVNKLIKIDSMEDPYSFSIELQNNILESLQTLDLNRYPDSNNTYLKELILDFFLTSFNKKQTSPATYLSNQDLHNKSLILGNGSDELILDLILCFNEGDSIASLSPSFSIYQMLVNLLEFNFITLGLNSNFSLDLKQADYFFTQNQPKIFFLANPNNPTGIQITKKSLIDLLNIISNKSPQTLVVLDEAYEAFANYNALDLLPNYDNLIIMRTFSKVGLAGIRLGVLMGDTSLMQQINKVRLPYNINSLTQSTLQTVLLKGSEELEQSIDKIKNTRDTLAIFFLKCESIQVFSSQANFISIRLINNLSGKADNIYKDLITEGILIKNLHKKNNPLEDILRITIGTEKEMTAFMDRFNKIISKYIT